MRVSSTDAASPDDLTRLLARAADGDGEALERAAVLVHHELRSIASRVLAGQRPGQTLCTTALVNEAFAKMLGGSGQRYEGRSHFLAVASRAMRSILVDYARARGAQKRGGGRSRVAIDEVIREFESDRLDLIALDDALDRLESRTPRQVRVVEMRFFAGLSIAQTASALGVSHGTVENDWRFARAWLHRELLGEAG